MTFFIATFGFLFVIGMTVIVTAGYQEQRKNKQLKNEFLKQFE